MFFSFLWISNSIALALNVPWLQPFKYNPGSTGVLYMVVLSLPREERYKEENVIISGILPGPAVPKLTANTYLNHPLVVELQKCGKLFSVNGWQLFLQDILDNLDSNPDGYRYFGKLALVLICRFLSFLPTCAVISFLLPSWSSIFYTARNCKFTLA